MAGWVKANLVYSAVLEQARTGWGPKGGGSPFTCCVWPRPLCVGLPPAPVSARCCTAHPSLTPSRQQVAPLQAQLDAVTAGLQESTARLSQCEGELAQLDEQARRARARQPSAAAPCAPLHPCLTHCECT